MTDEFAAPTASPPIHPSTESDWTDQVTDLIVHLVDSTRSRTTGPILKLARVAVYGLVALVVLVVVAVLGLALVGRGLSLIPIEMWISDAGVGLLMIGLGMLMWSRRTPA